MCLSLFQVRKLNAAVAICRCFPNGRCCLTIVYTAFDFKKFTFFKKVFKLKNCDQVPSDLNMLRTYPEAEKRRTFVLETA